MKLFKKFLLLLLLALGFYSFYSIPRLIIIRKIICNTQYGVCDETSINEVNKSLNKKIPDIKKELSIYLKNNFLVRDFDIQYRIPDVLEINLIIEKADYCLKSSNHDIYSYISKNGRVIELRSTCNLPTAYINNKTFNVGEIIENEYLSALNLLNQIFISYNIKEGNIVENYLEVNFNQGYKVIFPLDKDVQVLLGSLRLIVNRLNSNESESKIIEGRINVIDLRYKNPVLR